MNKSREQPVRAVVRNKTNDISQTRRIGYDTLTRLKSEGRILGAWSTSTGKAF